MSQITTVLGGGGGAIGLKYEPLDYFKFYWIPVSI
jgi:hypothetical protein